MRNPNTDFAMCPAAPALRPYIAYYAGFRAHGLTPSVHSGLPSRHVGLVISLAEPIEIVRMPDARQPPAAFTALVSGFQTGPTTLSYGSRRDGVFIHLTPPGVRAVLGVASAELSSRVIDFSSIWGRAAGCVVERLMASPTWRQRFAILDQVFLRALKPSTPPGELKWAWKRLAQTHGSIPIHQLAGETGWSRQHLRERFRAELGVTPKNAARIFRFEHAVRLIKQRPSLAQLAAACGFHDQAHMTLEWNALAGCTPKAWIANELPFFQYSEPAGGDDWVGEPDDIESQHRT